jgi:hypothetical protein
MTAFHDKIQDVQRDRDLTLLENVLAPEHEPEINEVERVMLLDIRSNITGPDPRWQTLSTRQRKLVESIWQRVRTIVGAPRGREVATPAVLQNLPKKPPGRRA